MTTWCLDRVADVATIAALPGYAVPDIPLLVIQVLGIHMCLAYLAIRRCTCVNQVLCTWYVTNNIPIMRFLPVACIYTAGTSAAGDSSHMTVAGIMEHQQV